MGACQDCWVATERRRAPARLHDLLEARHAPGRARDGGAVVSDAPATVIVGAGPAGMRAAQTLVAHGLRPVVIDEAPRWRRADLPPAARPGFERAKRDALRLRRPARPTALHGDDGGASRDRIDYRPRHAGVERREGDRLDLLYGGAHAPRRLQPSDRRHRRDRPRAAVPGLDPARRLHARRRRRWR